MKVHPAAKMFPLLIGKAFDDLVESIRDKGQQVPIMMVGDLLLDGRNRLAVCKKLGLKPVSEQWNGTSSQIDYIVAANLHRRHLTVSQKAKIAVDLIPVYAAEAKKRQKKHGGTSPGSKANTSTPRGGSVSKRSGEAAKQAAAAVGIGISSVTRLRAVKREAPDLMEKVDSGKLKIATAYSKLLERKGKKTAAHTEEKGHEQSTQAKVPEGKRDRQWAQGGRTRIDKVAGTCGAFAQLLEVMTQLPLAVGSVDSEQVHSWCTVIEEGRAGLLQFKKHLLKLDNSRRQK